MDWFKHCSEEEKEYFRDFHRFVELFRDFLKLLLKPVAATLTFVNSQGEKQAMSQDLLSNPPGKYVYQEFDQNGAPIAPVNGIVYSSDNADVATIDPASGQLAYVAAGTCNISASDGALLPKVDPFTLTAVVTPPTPTTATLTFVPAAGGASGASKTHASGAGAVGATGAHGDIGSNKA